MNFDLLFAPCEAKNRNIVKVKIIESNIVELGSAKYFEETRYPE